MKGMVFTEFLEMVEHKFGIVTAQEIIDKADLPNHGAYTSIGTYDHQEMHRLVKALHDQTETPSEKLLEEFGKYLFQQFGKNYPRFFEGDQTAFDFLDKLENFIHPEVLKLYPDAELPRFETTHRDENNMILIYHSSRKLADLAHGLIIGCLEHFEKEYQLQHEKLDPAGDHSRFTIRIV